MKGIEGGVAAVPPQDKDALPKPKRAKHHTTKRVGRKQAPKSAARTTRSAHPPVSDEVLYGHMDDALKGAAQAVDAAIAEEAVREVAFMNATRAEDTFTIDESEPEEALETTPETKPSSKKKTRAPRTKKKQPAIEPDVVDLDMEVMDADAFAEHLQQRVEEMSPNGIVAPEHYTPISESAIIQSQSFDDLEAALDTGDGLQGSQEYFEAALLHDIVARVRSGEYETHYLTRTHGLRDKVEELLAQEREQNQAREDVVVLDTEVTRDDGILATEAVGVAEDAPDASEQRRTPPPLPSRPTPPPLPRLEDIEHEMLQGSVSALPDAEGLMDSELSFDTPGTKRGITKKQKSAVLREVADTMPEQVSVQKTLLVQRFKNADQTAQRLSEELEVVKDVHRKRVLNPVTRFFVKHFGYGLKDQRRIRALEHSYSTALAAAEDARQELAMLDKAEPDTPSAPTRPKRGRTQQARV